MTKSPPIVFIARHGARLDAADKDWHLTSPTPYDPPLSYGGWMQARALGVRIGSLLRARQFTGEDPKDQNPPTSDDQASLNPAPTSDIYDRYNVIVHTSPYLRCLQTAIGVSAGIGSHPTETTEPSPSPVAAGSNPDPRCLLRVDAFLGEWLSPDYFDQITPPPSSDRMVASAKAELLRRAEVIPATDGSARALSGHFPGGWGSQSHPSSPTTEEEEGLHSKTTQPGPRQRASTYDTQQNPVRAKNAKKSLGRLNTDLPPILDASYVPPTPSYAVSSSDPIPTGYVAHARNACTKIDYQWDSLRTPYWGTGGEYGEEWSTMHERVHDGFQHMVNWYRAQGSSDQKAATTSNGASAFRDTQTVLVIITHGADCNALISALTGHSVLLDINTASLTMAVRRNRIKNPAPEDARNSPKHQGSQSVSREYSLQLVASTDHLRPGINPSQLTSLASPSVPQPVSPAPASSYRNRLTSRPSHLPGPLASGLPSNSMTSPRGWTLALRSSTNSRSASGLWGSMSPDKTEKTEKTEKVDKADQADKADKANDIDEHFVPNFGDRPASQDSALAEKPVDRWTRQLPQRTISQRGLWGSAPSLEDRDGGSKRRWTVTEQKL
ncbi:uncharacterized protein N7511_007035 [Penicillium nucicola]|uniref:uncharacterized protein n=1 Tax=Penicillium nucicola TaxID=1850975 RepID=UPI002544F052|nr:uncharacterized protein N7511_007035 [Penicillium nucicola]KAJ5758341.1 hypothetical protein N7511_007035 [Penicillium nucicola]